MKKKSLKDFGISEEQYARYLKYKLKLESKNNLSEYIFKILVIVCVPLIFIYFNINAWEIITKFYNEGSYFMIIIFVFYNTIIGGFVSLFIGFSFSGLLLLLISSLGVDDFAFKLFIKLKPSPAREPFFFRCEKYDLEEKKYKNYIDNLIKAHPRIADLNYDLQLFYSSIIPNLIEDEKKFVNDQIACLNLEKQKEYWLEMDGITFENEVTSIYKKLGYEAQTTKAVADGGVDIRLWKDEIYSIVQCKNHRKKIGPSIVRDLYGTMHREKASHAILICSGGFNAGVYSFVRGLPIELIDIYQFMEIVNKVNPQNYQLVNDISNYFSYNQMTRYEFKVIGEVFILYAKYQNAFLKDNKIHLPNPNKGRICFFENSESAKNELDLLKSCKNLPFEGHVNYEIAIFNLTNNVRSYYNEYIYYIRAIKPTDNFLLREAIE